ncbi:MAG TPA: DNA polymerase III subunit alpha [Phycisphaerae bacterium]|nr:DNA polymerase III subunit alpha [Phycisphaerae bacterium]
MEKFVHLHVHSHYSLLDGAARTEDLVEAAKAAGMDALALTDHGNLFGAIDFYTAARAAGIKPILGIEAYISPTTRSDRTMGNQATAAYHLLLLAMNETGWRNLVKLSSRAYLEGFYYRPRVDRELLAEFGEGLICTTACLGGEVPTALLSGQDKRARKIAGEYLDIFGRDRLFIEVQKQGIADQDQVNPKLLALAAELGVGVVGTNDVHFLRRESKKAHEVLTCISTGKTLAEGGALEYPPEIYLKSPAEMREALTDLGGAADTTLRIAEMCDVQLDFSGAHLPVFHTPDATGPGDYLRKLAREGLARRFEPGRPPEPYRQRLEWELEVIEDKGYSSYFLIVNDLVQYARRNAIPAAPRGSGVATLLGYALGIADVDPLRYGLLFERFTDPQRAEAPDLDIDLCQEGRAKVIQYVREKYGHVAQVITYGTLKARAVLRDVGRVLGVPLPEVDALAKKIPEGPGVTLDDALRSEPSLRSMYDSEPQVREMIDYGLQLEGLARHAGVHAAAVVIAQEPLENIVPLCKQSDSEDAITQWDGLACDKIGLMKIDFLGLRTLTIIQRARELVRERTGTDVDPEKLPLDDPEVFGLFRRGETDGIFQFESGGMKNVLVQMQPTRIEDLIAANAMYRPGPMELIDSYCARKNGTEPIPSIHPQIDDLLAETYGIMTYQEQVMQVVNRLGKIPLNRALTLIKAVSKKSHDKIAAERPPFMRGAAENGIPEDEAERLFELILKFGGYGFNKAHSTRYALVAYQAAHFKVHHPREFLAATLTFECGDTDKVVQYMAEAARMGVRIAPPDVNTCGRDFAVDGEQVRFGLAAVKGVGAKAVDAVVGARGEAGRFRDLYHFCEHVDLRAVNRTAIEALIKCGALDALGAHRAAMTAALDHAIQLGQHAADARRSGQLSLFGGGNEEPPAPTFPDVEPWSEAELLTAEKESLGFYITSHPLVTYGRELDSLSTPSAGQAALARIDGLADGAAITVGCMIASIRNTVTKSGRSAGKRMAMLTVEDLTGKCDAVMFSDAYEQYGPLLVENRIVFLSGRVDRRRERANIVVDEVIPIDKAIEELAGAVLLRLGAAGARRDTLEAVHGLLARHRGTCPVYIQLTPSGRSDVRATIRADRQCGVSPTRGLVAELVALLGDEKNVVLRPKPRPNSNGNNGNGSRRYYRRSGPQFQNGPASAAVTRFN